MKVKECFMPPERNIKAPLGVRDRCECIHNHRSGIDVFIIFLVFSGTSVYLKLKLVRSCVCFKMTVVLEAG